MTGQMAMTFLRHGRAADVEWRPSPRVTMSDFWEVRNVTNVMGDAKDVPETARHCSVVRVVLLATAFCLAGHPAWARVPEVRVKLEFVPTDAEETLGRRGVTTLPGHPIEVLPVVDVRDVPRDLIGKSLGRWLPDADFPSSRPKKFDVLIRATSNVAGWLTQTLSETFRDWGTPSTPGAELVLQVEIVKLFVIETGTFDADVSLRVAVKKRDGSAVWSGVVGGASSRFGRTMKESNYQEALSDALLSCYVKLWSDPAFRDARAGGGQRPVGSVARPSPAQTLEPEAAMRKCLELKEAGFEEGALLAWIKRVAFTRPLTADDMLNWKQAGVPQAVIAAAMESDLLPTASRSSTQH